MFKLKHIFQDEVMIGSSFSGGGSTQKKTSGHKQTFWTKGKPDFKSYRETRKQLIQKTARLNAKTEM